MSQVITNKPWQTWLCHGLIIEDLIQECMAVVRGIS